MQPRFPMVLLFNLWFSVLAPGVLVAGAPQDNDPNAGIRQALQDELEDFAVPGWNRVPADWPGPTGSGPFVPEAGPALEEYRAQMVRLADWTGGPVWHQAGTLPLVRAGRTAERLGVNVFLPPGIPKGTLLFVHGFMSHSANFAYTFAWFTHRGWAVTTLDLPGHGLSTGPRADVDEFGEYGEAVRAWLDWVKSQGWPGKKVLLAHSLGALAAYDALVRPGTPRPDRIVFCAPLLRTDWYPLLSLGAAVLGGVWKTAPTTFGWDGYLDGYAIPIHWYTALDRWLAGLDARRPVRLPLTIYTGDRDQVVDQAWNLAEYRRLVPGVKEVVLPGKDHLFLADKDDREAFLTRLWADLQG